MTKKDFFRVLIKVFGLYSLIITLFQFLPLSINYLGLEMDSSTFIYFLIPSLFVVGLFLYLIFGTDKIIGWLKLGSGFDSDEIKFGNLSPDRLVSIIVLTIGGVQVLDNIGLFLIQSFLGFKGLVQTNGLDGSIFKNSTQGFNWNDWFIALINLSIGVIVISNYQNISKWIQKTNNKNRA
jgi:hypothetical protein